MTGDSPFRMRPLVDQSAPALRSGAREAAKLDQALAAYRQVVDQCQLQAP